MPIFEPVVGPQGRCLPRCHVLEGISGIAADHVPGPGVTAQACDWPVAEDRVRVVQLGGCPGEEQLVAVPGYTMPSPALASRAMIAAAPA